MNAVSIAVVGAASLVVSADAGVLGFSSFRRTASNGNTVIDVFAVMSNASDRLLNIYNANLTTTQGGSTPATYVQQAGMATRFWEPVVFSSARSNIVDSFVTIGVDGGAPYNGEYYASAVTIVFGRGDQVLLNAGWFLSTTLPGNLAESMSGMTGARTNTGTAGTSNLGIWCAHLVMAPGTASVFWGGTSAVKDGVTGATVTTTALATNLIPAPGALALLGLAGFSSRRRRA